MAQFDSRERRSANGDKKLSATDEEGNAKTAKK
jgi:hypothetical protein